MSTCEYLNSIFKIIMSTLKITVLTCKKNPQNQNQKQCMFISKLNNYVSVQLIWYVCQYTKKICKLTTNYVNIQINCVYMQQIYANVGLIRSTFKIIMSTSKISKLTCSICQHSIKACRYATSLCWHVNYWYQQTS